MMKLKFETLDNMSQHFMKNPTKKEVIAIVNDMERERFYSCYHDQCINVTNETMSGK